MVYYLMLEIERQPEIRFCTLLRYIVQSRNYDTHNLYVRGLRTFALHKDEYLSCAQQSYHLLDNTAVPLMILFILSNNIRY